METVVGLDDLRGRAPTGVFFPEETEASLQEAILRFEKTSFDPDAVRAHALGFRRERFEKEMKEFVEKAVREGTPV
jgi:hypothetical protein